MKYLHNHPSKDIATALCLDRDSQVKISHAIDKAYNDVNPNVDARTTIDDFIAVIAPYISTAEEGFFAAITIAASIEAARCE
jgi:hypothetical protein